MPRRSAARKMISLNTAGEALTIRFAPRAARTMDQRFRAFVSMTSIVLFLPRNRCARVMSRSPHQTVCPWRVSRWASNEPVPPAPRTKMRIGAPLYHNRCGVLVHCVVGCFRIYDVLQAHEIHHGLLYLDRNHVCRVCCGAELLSD